MKLRKFRALVNQTGLDDLGMSGIVFRTETLIKWKIYHQADERKYCEVDYVRKPFFVDDIGCSRDIEKALKDKEIEEIFD